MTNPLRYAVIAAVLAVTAALLALPASAQETDSATYTVTEQEINDSFRVNNPRNRRISDVSVDFQPGQAELNYTLNYRGGSVDVTMTLVPNIVDGRVYWDLVSATYSDEAAPDELIAQANAVMDASWRSYFKGKFNGIVESITITETDMTWVVTPGVRLESAVESGAVNEDDTPRLWNFWNRRGNR